MNAEEVAKRLWDLQNYVTGFAVAQMLVVLITGGTSEKFRKPLHRQWKWVVPGMILFGILSAVVVILAHMAEMRIAPPAASSERILFWTVSMRVVLLLFVNCGGALVVFLKRHNP